MASRRISRHTLLAVTVTAVVATGLLSSAQAPSGRPRGAEPLVMDDQTGFTPIFDGKTMTGWDADPAFWRAEGGSLIGQSTPQNPVKENTFAIWRGGEPKDFELKVQYRMSATNSGIQIRSVHLPAGTPGDRPIVGNWVLKGYQADIDFNNQYTGQIYEERGRGFLAMRGQSVYVPDGGSPKVIGNLQQTPDELKALIKTNDWNQVHLIARGTTILQILNGAVTSIVVDDDTRNRALGGLIGFQMHTGDPMKVEFRHIWLKNIGAQSSSAGADEDQAIEQTLAEHRRLVRDWGRLARYGSDNTELPEPKASEARVVFFGDQITERWGGGDSKFFPGKPYVNRGISGQTTSQMLVRFRQDVIMLEPKVVVINGGSNDLIGLVGPGSEGTVQDAVKTMTELAKLHGIKVVIASVTPICNCTQNLTDRLPQGKIIGLNGWLRSYAKESGSIYLDYYGSLVIGRDFKQELTSDGVLPNDAGYAVMAGLAEQAIAQALERSQAGLKPRLYRQGGPNDGRGGALAPPETTGVRR